MRTESPALARLLAFFLLCFAFACTNSKSDTPPAPPADMTVQSSLSRDMSPQASDADLAGAVAGSTTFALKAFALIDPVGTQNVVFSPYSVTEAFALMAPGARGTTLGGIETALSFLPQDRQNPALNKLDLLITSEASGTITPLGYQYPIFKNANAIWGQKGLSFLSPYLDTLAVNYGAGLHVVDFVNATEDARGTINAWVEDKTNNRIQDLIPQGGVSQLTRVVLTNAVWFKANWAQPFSALSTTNQTFYNRDGFSSSTSFMHQTLWASYTQADGCQAVDLPYYGDKFSMLVIMPDTGTFDSFLPSLTPTTLADITGRLTLQEVALSFPKFSFTQATKMSDILRALGMTDAFNAAVADFSGIDGSRDLSISDVFHKAFISVDEQGTEAAAATAIVGAGSAGPPPQPLVFSVDHPFLFFIRERQTGLILFMGKVVGL